MASTKKTPPPAASAPAANATDEPQTLYLMPAAGGSYVRNKDGSLTCAEKPTAVPAFNPKAKE